MLSVDYANHADIPAWLALAAELEPLFGPMLDDPAFTAALERNIARQTALCIRSAAPQASILAGLLYSPKAPLYKLNWMGVTAAQRRNGLGEQLYAAMLQTIRAPATIEVCTFGADHPGGPAARSFYSKLGFVPAEPLPAGPEGGSRQMFRLQLES
jgi:GNAT superfamily N-acetyltransferase